MSLLAVLIPLIAAFVAIAGAIVSGLRLVRPGRMPRPRRLVNYRVHYDDSLGTRPDIKGVAELVVRRRGKDVPDASLVMIRISNEGGLDIGQEHWVMPMNFTFDGRDVVGVEVSEPAGAPRGRPPIADSESIRISKGKKALELPKVDLKRRDRVRLLVLLSGPRDNRGPGVRGDATLKGAVRGGGLVREVTPGRGNLYTFGWAACALVALVAAVVVTVVARPFSSSPPAAATDCVTGSILVEGSTAFGPAVQAVAAALMKQCPQSVVSVNPPGSAIGSEAGTSDLADTGDSASVRATKLAISDGAVSSSDYPKLRPHPVAIVIFSVVVNSATKVHSLTDAQIAGIWSGRYTNWRQLGGASLPIDIIARNTDSGTRATFDATVLDHRSEPPQSSESCTKRDLIPRSPVIICDKSSTKQLLQSVNAIPGAIGYAETAQASTYPDVDEIQLNGRDASPGAVKSKDYPFWATEYLYTYGTPPVGSLLSFFLRYMLTNDTAKSLIQGPDYEDIPCSLTLLCG
jgi:phosphate transport system substrate-binding protein